MAEDSLPLVEYIRGKIYLGAYDYVPEDTPERVYLTIDDTLPYAPFNHDFGPLTIAHLYRFAVILHDVLGSPENKDKELVFYSYTDPRSRANAATLLVSYMILIQSWLPHQVLAPISQMAPIMPFRDAGYSVADYCITIQDVAYALWRAKNHNLFDMKAFNLEEHEMYEHLENGDLNAIGKHFVAFASPHPTSQGLDKVQSYFKKHNVKLVVRLNSKLYEKEIFESRGIKHIDLMFTDGTCPPMAYVHGFIGAAEGVIRDGGKIAVHCRAGLGRTGCLIGAHLIYTYGFTANECIAYMRFLRPGMVVGPQQHWLYYHQYEFREWRRTMRIGRNPDPSLAGYTPLVDASSYLNSSKSRNLIAEDDDAVDGKEDVGPHTPERNILTPCNPATVNACLPQPTPGQPRKSSPVQAQSAPPPAGRYYSTGLNGNTNSDDEEDGEEDSGSSMYEDFEEEADVIISTKRVQQPPMQVTKQRTSAAASMRVQSRASSRSGSLRSVSTRSSSRQRPASINQRPRSPSRKIDQNSENSTIIVSKQRRNLSELPSPQQIALANQLRVVSNPSPRRKHAEESLEQIKVEEVFNRS